MFARRLRLLERMRGSPAYALGAREYYRTRPVEFIEDWCDTIDPRNAFVQGRLTRMPLILFPRQRQLVEFLQTCLENQRSGLIEKSRDIGATWVCGAFSAWLWLHHPGASVGWGSRKAILVDRIGDVDSIFEKIRKLIGGLPPELLPAGFGSDCMTYMKILNPENGASITGESGDEIGRGGRKLIYFKDESAHYERPELIEAALADNTNVQIDISSVAGLGNVFHRRREAGREWTPGTALDPTDKRTLVFIVDWRDHPAKDQAWYDARRAKAESEGLLHVFAQEVDRDYSASVVGTIIPAAWVNSAIDAHLKIPGMEEGLWSAALDVADGGSDLNALVKRKGVVVRYADDWGAPDCGVTTRRAASVCATTLPITLQYDCIGVGSAVKAEANRLVAEKLMPRGLKFVPWNAGSAPLLPDDYVGLTQDGNPDPETPLNRDFYANLKAQAWWQLRLRFERTHRAITEGVEYDPGDLISLPSSLPRLAQLRKELSQPTKSETGALKMRVDKAPDGTRSPNLGDAAVMCFWPCGLGDYPDDLSSWVGF